MKGTIADIRLTRQAIAGRGKVGLGRRLLPEGALVVDIGTLSTDRPDGITPGQLEQPEGE